MLNNIENVFVIRYIIKMKPIAIGWIVASICVLISIILVIICWKVEMPDKDMAIHWIPTVILGLSITAIIAAGAVPSFLAKDIEGEFNDYKKNH